MTAGPLRATCAALCLVCSGTRAHFQLLVPSADILVPARSRTVDLDIRFTHPMENGPVMDMGEPVRFGVMLRGERHDLLDSLRVRQLSGKTAYTASYTARSPGDHVFYVEPAPYWEPAERKMIIHYTKVVVNAFGEESGWDEAIGFPVEIEPLVRPYGLWTGNTFRGIVRRDGKPVPFAEIEVEYLNADSRVTPPADPFITQVIKADATGAFSYALPRAGWWSFAALIDGDSKLMNPDGELVDVELGALIWVRCVDMK